MAKIYIEDNRTGNEACLVGESEQLCCVGIMLVNCLYDSYDYHLKRGHSATADSIMNMIRDINVQLGYVEREINYLGCNED